MPADVYTEQLLTAMLDRPNFLAAQDTMFLVDRLKDLLRQGWKPRLVHAVANILVENAGRGLGDLGTLLSMSAEDLIEIALTLHRLVETRSQGLDLFERLLAIDAHGVNDRLGILDRRPFR